VISARFAAVDQAAAFEEQEHWDRRLSTLLQSRPGRHLDVGDRRPLVCAETARIAGSHSSSSVTAGAQAIRRRGHSAVPVRRRRAGRSGLELPRQTAANFGFNLVWPVSRLFREKRGPGTKGRRMQLLATYTFGQALLTVLEFMLLILWIWLAITVIMDLFRSHDLNGWKKAFWLVLIVLLPLLGVLIYVIARGDEMKAHGISDQRQQEIASIAELEDLKDRGILTDEEFQRVKRQRKLSQQAPPSPDDDIAELEGLRDRGLLTEEEFKRAKEKALA
jgi:hypothetical protein